MTPKRLSAIAFFLVLAAFSIVSILLPRKTFSDAENRYLATFPRISMRSYLDGSAMESLDDYFSDHFLMRNTWISAKTQVELLSGQREIGGVYILEDRLIEKMETPDAAIYTRSIDAINAFAARNPDLPVSVLIAPTAQAIYKQMLPENTPIYNQRAFLEQCSELFEKDISVIDAYAALYPMREDYIYYRNDHHWTTLGAYYAYVGAANKLGFSPNTLDQYDIEHAAHDFKGTLYSKNLYNGIQADVVDFYHPTEGEDALYMEVKNESGVANYGSLYFREYLSTKDKYAAFLGQNQPLVSIVTTHQEAGKLLLIKDSYAHSLVSFLAAHYSEITVVDLRYINVPLSELVDIDEYSQALFLYNAINFSTDENVRKLDFDAQ